MNKKNNEQKIESTGSTVQKFKKNIKKAVAIGVSTAVLTVGSVAAIEAEPVDNNLTPEIMNPDPVVLEIEEVDAINQESETNDEEETKRRGLLCWLKMALYGFFAGIAGFVAAKIPWKKVLTRRNLIILLIIVAAFLIVRYVLPLFIDMPWGPDYPWISKEG